MLSWTKPFVHDTPWIIGFDADRSTSKRQSDDYELKSYGFATHATYPVNRFFRVSTHYRLRHESVQLEGGGKKNTLLDEESRNDGDISALGVTLVFDSVNHPIRPTNGFRSQFDTEFAGIGGEHRFLLFAYQNTYYLQVYKSGVLKFRGDARFLQPIFGTHFHTLPLNERFFMGGETTVRGYASYRIGPLYSNLAPRGGISAMLFSTELNHSFTSRFSGFLFFDAGYASKEQWEILPFRSSVGFGVRIYMMENMPLMVGYGFPLNPERHGDVQRFFFSIGGHF
jgi:outer membrane protein insertion porin family